MIEIRWKFTCDVCGATQDVAGRVNAAPADELPTGYSFFRASWVFRNPANTAVPVERTALCCKACIEELTNAMAGKETSYMIQAVVSPRRD